MTAPFVIGVDPGGTTGIAVYTGRSDSELLQCTPGLVLPTVRTLLGVYEGAVRPGALLAVERFVVGTRAARSASARSGEIARELIGALADLGPTYGVRVVHRSASEVKPWATDKRLEAAGLLVRGMPHACDAARHALYAAVKDGGLPDPLSRKSRPAPRRTA